jgi:hypothetical protein
MSEPNMTDEETVAHLREWASGGGSYGVWAWPTDACGYNQHIRFVTFRNLYWENFEGTFADFVRWYADELQSRGSNNHD